MLVVTTLKIVSGTGNETTQFTAQKQRGQDVAVIVGRFVGTGIADSYRECGFRCRQLQAYGDRVVGFVCCIGAQLIDALNRFDSTYFRYLIDILHRSEEQAVGQYLPITVEKGHIVDTSRQILQR